MESGDALTRTMLESLRKFKLKVSDLNSHLSCILCGGYFIDATTVIECLHSFCRACIVRYLETSKYCPVCEVQIHKTRPLRCIRPDKTLQDTVYKIVPGLYQNEMKKRRELYASQPPEALKESRDAEDRGDGLEERFIYTADEIFDLSVEYNHDENATTESSDYTEPLRRFLRCPAAITVSHLKKFIRLKYNIPIKYQVDLQYQKEALEDGYSLIDVAYIFNWKRVGPLQFFYRIQERPKKLAKPPRITCVVNPIQPEIKADEPENDVTTIGPTTISPMEVDVSAADVQEKEVPKVKQSSSARREKALVDADAIYRFTETPKVELCPVPRKTHKLVVDKTVKTNSGKSRKSGNSSRSGKESSKRATKKSRSSSGSNATKHSMPKISVNFLNSFPRRTGTDHTSSTIAIVPPSKPHSPTEKQEHVSPPKVPKLTIPLTPEILQDANSLQQRQKLQRELEEQKLLQKQQTEDKQKQQQSQYLDEKSKVYQKQQQADQQKLQKQQQADQQKLQKQQLEDKQQLQQKQQSEDKQKLKHKQQLEDKQKSKQKQQLEDKRKHKQKQQLEDQQKLQHKQQLENMQKLHQKQQIEEQRQEEHQKQQQKHQLEEQQKQLQKHQLEEQKKQQQKHQLEEQKKQQQKRQLEEQQKQEQKHQLEEQEKQRIKEQQLQKQQQLEEQKHQQELESQQKLQEQLRQDELEKQKKLHQRELEEQQQEELRKKKMQEQQEAIAEVDKMDLESDLFDGGPLVIAEPLEDSVDAKDHGLQTSDDDVKVNTFKKFEKPDEDIDVESCEVDSGRGSDTSCRTGDDDIGSPGSSTTVRTPDLEKINPFLIPSPSSMTSLPSPATNGTSPSQSLVSGCNGFTSSSATATETNCSTSTSQNHQKDDLGVLDLSTCHRKRGQDRIPLSRPRQVANPPVLDKHRQTTPCLPLPSHPSFKLLPAALPHTSIYKKNVPSPDFCRGNFRCKGSNLTVYNPDPSSSRPKIVIKTVDSPRADHGHGRHHHHHGHHHSHHHQRM